MEQLQALADRHGLSLAWVIRQAINEFLARLDQPASFDPWRPGRKADVQPLSARLPGPLVVALQGC
ncbi:CopG family transcriptional regulator [Azotobacter sp. CWF10]